jgi:hypothetical protein
MTNRFTTLAAAAALFLGVCGQARAGDNMAPITTIGHWKLAASSKLCQASGKYADDTALEFSINDLGAAFISIVNPEWKIPKGDYEIASWIDGAPASTFKATAKDTWLFWQFNLNEANINRLSYGNVLHVQIGYQTFHYKLDRSEGMLKALGKCAAPKMAAANPFNGSPPASTSKTPPASTETPSNPFRRL